ncbi:MAG: RidA family protein [Proteobacteria bacterium]|nr:RidA family protein [Pseudomonadota bacterium]
MAIKFLNPKTVSFSGKYSLAAEVPPGTRLLYVSGQVGTAPDGKLPVGFEAQCEQVWMNIGEVLRDAGMTYKDIVKVTVFLTDSRFTGPYREIRDRFVKEAPYPASTLLVVAGLADPAMLVEVEVVAAKA